MWNKAGRVPLYSQAHRRDDMVDIWFPNLKLEKKSQLTGQ